MDAIIPVDVVAVETGDDLVGTGFLEIWKVTVGFDCVSWCRRRGLLLLGVASRGSWSARSSWSWRVEESGGWRIGLSYVSAVPYWCWGG
jgi:hypothetical protein